jgi:hypothetical protein
VRALRLGSVISRSIPAAVAVAAMLPAAAHACDAQKHVAAGHGRQPLAIGDSVMLGAVAPLARAGFEVDAKGCRQMRQGIDILRRRRRARTLPAVVVVALGTNASITRRDIRAALRVIGPRHTLALVTPRELGGGSGADAAAVRSAGRRFPGRVVVVDWVRYSGGHGAWFAGDGIHLSAAGARGMTRLLRRAVTPPCP